ncbi:DUF3293 domain-containing protein [Lujinxingia sediminis]|uniref:DUF3293 domain-containing protein n=2 Tax=Lujinxingia sediminis TaxID=2480984 RepID=A0ABY0CNE3_9DELT|nr:DUF3293 domain-containing protein [Lujinxingia sediminis]
MARPKGCAVDMPPQRLSRFDARIVAKFLDVQNLISQCLKMSQALAPPRTRRSCTVSRACLHRRFRRGLPRSCIPLMLSTDSMTTPPTDDAIFQAYTEAIYEVVRDEAPIVLRVGDDVGALLGIDGLDVQTPWAVITAYNPASRLRSAAENARAHAALADLLHQKSLPHLPTRARDPRGEWPVEDGFLIFPIEADDARKIARRFAQHAALIGRGPGPAELLDCRVTPDSRLPPRVVEAMRLGVVPDESVDAYTVGRDAELNLIDDDLSALAHGAGNLRVLLADYGAGKTHLLEVIARRALAQNYLVARVVLDAEGAAPSHPGRVYRGLIDQLTYPERPDAPRQGLTPLFERALQSSAARTRFELPAPPERPSVTSERPSVTSERPSVTSERPSVTSERPSVTRESHRPEPSPHLYLSAALTHFERLSVDAHPELRDRLMRWIEGQPVGRNRDLDQALRKLQGKHRTIYSLKDYRPWARIYAYLLSGIDTLARDAGYQGLVLLFDEAERFALLSSENRSHAENLFKAMAAASVGADAAPFERDDLSGGGLGVLQTLPARYHSRHGLLAIFAMTPDDQGVDVLRQAAPKEAFIDLNLLDGDDFEKLASQVLRLYRDAHEEPLPTALDTLLPRIVSGLHRHGLLNTPRQSMKFIVELLDIARRRPAQLREAVSELQGLLNT